MVSVRRCPIPVLAAVLLAACALSALAATRPADGGRRALRAPALRAARPALPGPAAPGVDAPGDVDDDGVADESDNCPFDANAGQQDADGDGMGDACDAFPNGGPLTFRSEVQLPRPDFAFGFDVLPVGLAEAPSGRLHVLLATAFFDQGTGVTSPRNLHASYSDDNGQTWSTPVKVNTYAPSGGPGAFWFTFVDFAVDDAGRVFATYDIENGSIVLVRSTDGGVTFSHTVIAGPDASPGGFSSVAARGDRVYVAWDDEPACSDSVIRQRVSSDGGATFGTESVIAGLGSCFPELAVASDGDVHLAYSDDAVIGFGALATSPPGGGSYGAPTQIIDRDPTADELFIFPLGLAEGDAGHLFSSWVIRGLDSVTSDPAYNDTWTDRSLNAGGSFGTDLALTGHAANASVDLVPGGDQWHTAARAGGQVVHVLRDGTVHFRQVRYARSTDGGATYSQPQPVWPPEPLTNEGEPVVAFDAAGNVLAAFSRVRTDIFEPAIAYFFTTRDFGGGGGGGEVTGLMFAANKVDFSWDPLTGASGYDVARGDLRQVLADGNLSGATGFSCNQPGTSASDPATPSPAGEGFYYLVRGRDAGGGMTWGSGGGTPDRDAAIGACP
ncbi:MAG: hypothetical protein Kow0062_23540 [Acidobacteriota bacterium]